MNFERGKDTKEVLKIGRKANAIHVHKFDVQGIIAFPIDRKKLTAEISEKYNLRGKAEARILFNFQIEEPILIFFLEVLERSGICKELDNCIHEMAICKTIDTRGLHLGEIPVIKEERSFDLKDIFIITRSPVDLAINVDTGPLFEIGREKLRFSLTGRDLLYQNRLYRIAEPKDGY